MSEFKKIQIQKNDGSISDCLLIIDSSTDKDNILLWQISLSGADYTDVIFKTTDLYKALVAMRKELEKVGSTPLCQGLRKDIIVSGMSRSMGGGRKAYVIRLGLHSSSDNLVDIFDYVKPELIASLEEQEKFQEEWFKTPRKYGIKTLFYRLRRFWADKFFLLKIPK